MKDQKIKIAITGHVDHGKSTVIGRLLLDSGSLSEDRIEEIEKIKQDYEDTIDGKDKYIIELEKKQEGFQQENQKIKCDYEHTIDGKDKYIEELEKKQISLQQEILKIKHDFEQTFDDKDAYIKELET